MSDEYLWDRSGKPDPEIERLERLLERYRYQTPATGQPIPFPVMRRGFSLWQHRLAAAAAIALVVLAGVWMAMRSPGAAWEVARVEGAPRVGSEVIGEQAQLRVGQSLVTDAASRARVRVGRIGEVELEPNSRLRMLRARWMDYRVGLDVGRIYARIWAPPGLFSVETPSAVAVDLGCAYTLEVDEEGAGLLRVISGWVGFEFEGRESFVPSGAMCPTRPGVGPGTPYYADASEDFRAALASLDFELNGVAGGVPVGIKGGVPGGVAGGVPGGVAGGIAGGVEGGVSGGVPGGIEGVKQRRAAALGTLLSEARRRDALTLWHLLSRTRGAERERVFERMAELVPPPKSVTREGILSGNRRMLDAWWNELGLDSASWWRLWKGPAPRITR